MLWIIGQAFKDARDYLTSHHIPYGILTNKSSARPANQDGTPSVSLNYSSPNALITSADKARLDITSVLVAGYENYVLPAAVLAEHFGLPGIRLEAAAATTDKALMRAAFKAYNPTISPDFQVVNSWQDIEDFMSSHTYPVMLKPTNLMKSLYITKNKSYDVLQVSYRALQKSLAAVSHKVYTMYPPRIMIEEYLPGSMHTVAGYATAEAEVFLFDKIVDCMTGHDVGKDENYIYSRQLPSRLDRAASDAVLHVAQQGVEALGLSSTMLHIEIMLTAAGPKIIEIGARIGGYRTRMYSLTNGLDMTGMMVDLARGKTPSVITNTELNPTTTAVIELFPDVEGHFDGTTNVEQLRRLPSLQYVSIKPAPGALIGRSSRGYKAAAVIILSNQDKRQFDMDFEYLRSQVHVTVT